MHADSNGGGGISCLGIIANSTTAMNGGFGILAGPAIVTGNISFSNATFGLFVECPSVVTGNTSYGNGNSSLFTLPFFSGATCAVANNAAQ